TGKRGHDGGFFVVGRREIDGADGLELRIFPIVIRSDQGAVAIVELDGGIEQRIGDAKTRQRRSEGAENHDGTIAIADNDTADQDVVTGADETARAQVAEGGAARGGEIVDFDNAVAGATVLAGKLHSVLAGREVRDYDRFPVVARGEAAA